MTQEEKAKAYDNALEKAKVHINRKGIGDTVDLCKHLFSELAENEDERIRKALVKYFEERNNYRDEDETFNGIPFSDIIAYLEKQKDASKAIEAVDRIDKYIDEHLANAHDMKDSNPDKKYYRGWDDALGKMAGILQDVYSDEKQKEQKPTDRFEEAREKYQVEWSEEDNIGWDEAFACVTRAEKAAKNEEELQNAVTAEKWLKEIKFKYCVHPVKQEWSGRDEEILEFVLGLLDNLVWRRDWEISQAECLEWLVKSLNPTKQEWGEEDEKMRVNILNALTPQLVYSVGKGTCTGTSTYKYDDEIKWLKSLRPSWKPSEEQMEALEEEILNQWEDYPHDKWPKCPYHDFTNIARHFYELGQSQMPMPEDTVLFNKGVAEGRRLEREDIMKDAVECELYWDGDFLAIDLNMVALGYSEKDKVKVIVLKDESK